MPDNTSTPTSTKPASDAAEARRRFLAALAAAPPQQQQGQQSNTTPPGSSIHTLSTSTTATLMDVHAKLLAATHKNSRTTALRRTIRLIPVLTGAPESDFAAVLHPWRLQAFELEGPLNELKQANLISLPGELQELKLYLAQEEASDAENFTPAEADKSNLFSLQLHAQFCAHGQEDFYASITDFMRATHHDETEDALQKEKSLTSLIRGVEANPELFEQISALSSSRQNEAP